jgi:hypothetical protein
MGLLQGIPGISGIKKNAPDDRASDAPFGTRPKPNPILALVLSTSGVITRFFFVIDLKS